MSESAPDFLTRLLTDQSERWGRGQPVDVEWYLQRHPELAGDDERLLDLISNEIYLRGARGDAAPVEEYCRRFPRLAEQIELQFQLHRAGGPSLASIRSRSSIPERPADLIFDTHPVFPDYEIVEEIGRGGMGVVYKARQLSLRRVVALKVVRILGRDAAVLHGRFRAEAQAVARLQHANIVQIFEVGEHQGYSYFSLELVDGGSLAGRIKGKRLSDADAARHMATLARAMHYVHQRGVVHRDLKPANILLAADGMPKITDFGLAKLARANQRLTRTGDVLGTPSYMAPEQARGDVEVGAAADVYSLGAILYELLTGQPPFRGEGAISTLLLVGTAPVKPPREWRPDLDPDLNAICLKCLSKEPSQRYATAQALADDLDRFLAGHIVQARPLGPLTRLARGWRRVRRQVVTTAGVLLLAALLIAGGVLYVHRLRRDLDDALQQRDRAVEAREAAQSRGEAAEVERGEWHESARIAREALRKSVPHLEEAREKLRRSEAENAKNKQAFAEANRLEQESRQALELARRTYFAGQLADAAQSWLVEPERCRRIVRDDSRCPADLRDFTWELLDHGRDFRQLTLRDHTGTISAVAVAPDSRALVSGADDGARLWDLDKASEPQVKLLPRGRVLAAAFAPKGKIVATAGADGIHLCDLAGKPLHKMSGHRGPVNALTFTPNGKNLFSAGQDGDIRVWNAQTGKEEKVFTAHERTPIHAVAISPNGGYLATAGDDLTVKFWAEKTTSVRGRLLGHSGRIHALAFSPDGKFLASGSADETVRLWDTESGEVKQILTNQGGIVEALALSRDGRTLAAGIKRLGIAKDEPAGAVKLWDIPSGRLARTLLFPQAVRSVAYFGDGRLVVADGKEVHVVADALHVHAAPILAGAISSDGRTLASGDRDGIIKLTDLATGAVRHTLKGHTGGITGLIFHPSSSQLISSSSDGTLRLWDSTTGKVRKSIESHGGGVNCLALSRNGGLVAAGGKDRVRLWSPTLEESKGTLGHGGVVSGIAFSADGGSLASCGVDGSLKLWRSADGELIRTLQQSGAGIHSLAFLADGRTLTSGAADGTVTLWDTAIGKAGLTLTGHRGEVRSLVLSPDGKLLAAGAGSPTGTAPPVGEVRLWDPVVGRLRGVLTGQEEAVTGLAFSPDGLTLIATSLDKTVKVWDAAGR